MKVVVLSSFPPTKCGIGAYAEQQARGLEQKGHNVRRIDVHELNKNKWTGASLSLLESSLLWSDKVIVHYQPSLLRSKTGLPVAKSVIPYLRLTSALKYGPRDVEVVVHEDFAPTSPVLIGLQESIAERFFSSVDVATFHTKIEADSFKFSVKEKRVVAPEYHYQRFSSLSKLQARNVLGVDVGVKAFVTAGFYHPGKGFERLIKAFVGLDSRNHLYIVTSDREGRFSQQMNDLRALAKSKNVHVIDRYVSDVEFDNWIQSADVVVIPYIRGFTSSVLARARIYGKPCIASNLPAIAEQANGDVALVSSDEELAQAIRAVAV